MGNAALHETSPQPLSTGAKAAQGRGEVVYRSTARGEVSRSRSFTRTDLLLLLIAAVVVLLYVAGAGPGFPLDDSWIHQTYARNLAQTGQWAFVPGVPSAASTSPLYTILLAAGYALGIPYAVWTHTLGALALGLTGMAGARLAARLMPNNARLPLLVGLALVLNWHLIWAAAAGMETALFSLWTLVVMGLALYNTAAGTVARPRDGLIFGAVAALAALTRPEGLLLAGLGGLAVALGQVRRPARLAVWALAAVLAFAVVLAPYVVYNYGLTGGFLPDTAAAKQAEYAPLLALPYVDRVARMAYPLAAGILPLLLPGLAGYVIAVARKPERGGATLAAFLPVLWSVALIGLYAARLPANYQHGRYVIPAIPGLVLAGVLGLAWLLTRSRRALVSRVITRSLALAAAVVGLAFALVLGSGVYRQDVTLIQEEMVTAARWVAANVPADALLAVHDIGAVGYFAPRPLLDLAGLVSPEVVPRLGDAEALWALLQARDARYLMAFPDQIPGQDASDRRLCRVFSTEGQTGRSLGQPNMVIFVINWDDNCSPGL